MELILVIQHVLDLDTQFARISFIPISGYVFKRHAAIRPCFDTPDRLVKAHDSAMQMILSIVLGENIALFSQFKSTFGDAVGDASHDYAKMRLFSCFVILRVVEPENDVIEPPGIVCYFDCNDRRSEIGNFDGHAIGIAQGNFADVRLIDLQLAHDLTGSNSLRTGALMNIKDRSN